MTKQNADVVVEEQPKAGTGERELVSVGGGLFRVDNSPGPVWDVDYFAPPVWVSRVKKETSSNGS